MQPQINLSTNAVESAEALVRRIDKEGIIEAPFKFIPLYEKEGIIHYLDFYVFESVCSLLSKWQKIHKINISIAVNFSRYTLQDKNIVSTLSKICKQYDVPPSSLIIEITETVQSIDNKQLITILDDFANSEFSLALDDFGSGYSNLSMLVDSNFDELKLDKSLVDNLVGSEKARVMTKYSLGLCDDLAIHTSVAEGVETSEQYEILKKLNCTKGQGFYFDKPMPIDEFERKYVLAAAR